MGKHTFLWTAGSPLHDILFAVLHGKGKGRQAVGHEVYPEDVDGQKRYGQAY